MGSGRRSVEALVWRGSGVMSSLMSAIQGTEMGKSKGRGRKEYAGRVHDSLVF